MDINFISDPNLTPKPRNQIRVENIQAELMEGERRIRIGLNITPFAPSDRPNVSIHVARPDGSDAGEISVVETMHNQISMTFHLRDEVVISGVYHIRAALYFDEDTLQGTAETDVTIPSADKPDIPPHGED